MNINLYPHLRFLLRRRWALLFLNAVAGLALAPFLYWDGILMRVVIAAAHDDATLLGLNTLNVLGGMLFLLPAAIGIGGCMAVLRKILSGTDGFLPGELRHGIKACAKTSLLAGTLIGLSLAVTRVGLLNLHMQPLLPGPWRAALTAILVLQLLATLPLCLLALTQGDELQRRPLRAFMQAGRQFAAQPLRHYGLLAATVLPAVVLFAVEQPLLKLLGFLAVMTFALSPIMLAWQKRNFDCCELQLFSIKKRAWLPTAIFAALSAIALITPMLLRAWQGITQSTFGETITFISRQALLEADNGTFRNLLAASSVWPLLIATLLGSACLILMAYVCADYSFRAKKLVFASVVLLQLLPMLSRYSALDQLLRNLNLNIPSAVLISAWAGLYLLTALLLYYKFARMLPQLSQNRAKFPGVRLFFYYALPRVRLPVIAIFALTTLGSWADALAPFWHMRELGAFSLGGHIWQSLPTWVERLSYLLIIFAVFGVFLLVLEMRKWRKKENGAHK